MIILTVTQYASMLTIDLQHSCIELWFSSYIYFHFPKRLAEAFPPKLSEPFERHNIVAVSKKNYCHTSAMYGMNGSKIK
jgi:hypothetical protein